MESLLFRRLIFIFFFIFTFFSIVCYPVPVNGFDIYLSPDSPPTSQSDSISSYGVTDNQQSLQSIASAISATTEDSDGISDTQISKSVLHSVLKAKRARGTTANRPVPKSKRAGGTTAKRPVLKPKKPGGTTANRAAVLKSKTAGGSNANRELRKICGKTENPSLCISTVAPRLRGGGANARAVLDIAIKASYELAKSGAAKAKKLAMTSRGSSGIKDCKGSFDDALSNFDLAIKAFQKKDVGTMNSMLSAVVTDMSDCDDSLGGEGSTLITMGDKLATMTSNCLGIISQMH